MDAQEVIEKYHGLTQIEDQFRVMKGDLDTRPLYVRTPETCDSAPACLHDFPDPAAYHPEKTERFRCRPAGSRRLLERWNECGPDPDGTEQMESGYTPLLESVSFYGRG